MASLNKVFLIGNLTRDPELRHTNSGMAVCEMGLAVSRRYVSNGQDKEEVCFVDILAWGKQGESCQRHISKGDPILVEGRLQLDQWSDRDSGAKRSKLRVVADRIQFLARREGGRDGGYDNSRDGGYDNGRDGGYDNEPDYNQGYNQSYNQNSGGNSWQQSPPPQQAGGAWGNSFQQQPQKPQYGGGRPPQMPDGAFDVDGTEDDIPF